MEPQGSQLPLRRTALCDPRSSDPHACLSSAAGCNAHLIQIRNCQTFLLHGLPYFLASRAGTHAIDPAYRNFGGNIMHMYVVTCLADASGPPVSMPACQVCVHSSQFAYRNRHVRISCFKDVLQFILFVTSQYTDDRIIRRWSTAVGSLQQTLQMNTCALCEGASVIKLSSVSSCLLALPDSAAYITHSEHVRYTASYLLSIDGHLMFTAFSYSFR